MRKNVIKLLALAMAFMLIALTLAACGSDSSGYSKSESASRDGISGSVLEDSGKSENSGSVSANRKIIETVYLDLQTKEFDDLLSKIEAEIKAIGGYTEKSAVYGNSLGESSGNRSADYTVRVPAKKSAEFTEFISSNSTVSRKETTTEDVTLTYVDTESHIAALETEKAALEDLLSKAGTMADIISVRDRLTSVIYEIETYKSQLRTYDNLVDYATVHISVMEVERITAVKEKSVWTEIGENLKEAFKKIANAARALFVYAVSSLPYLAVIAIIVFAIVLLLKLTSKRSRKKAAKRALPQSGTQNAEENNTEQQE